jgi:hypothetical protein
MHTATPTVKTWNLWTVLGEDLRKWKHGQNKTLETKIWVCQKWGGIILCAMPDGGRIRGLVDGQLGVETHQLTNKKYSVRGDTRSKISAELHTGRKRQTCPFTAASQSNSAYNSKRYRNIKPKLTTEFTDLFGAFIHWFHTMHLESYVSTVLH